MGTLGNFYGPVHVFTDRPNCFGRSNWTGGNVFVTPAVLEDSRRSTVVKCKQLKMKLLDLLDSSDFVLYMDVDVVVTQPMGPFLASIERGYNNDPRATAFMFQQPHKDPKREPFHSGVFTVARGRRSEQCMEAWGNIFAGKAVPAIGEPSHARGIAKDQQAIGKVGVWSDAPDGNVTWPCRVHRLKDEFLSFPDRSVISPLSWESKAKRRPLFLHFTNSGRLHMFCALSKAFVRDTLQLGLSETGDFNWLNRKESCSEDGYPPPKRGPKHRVDDCKTELPPQIL